jgi:hypothetical protein
MGCGASRAEPIRPSEPPQPPREHKDAAELVVPAAEAPAAPSAPSACAPDTAPAEPSSSAAPATATPSEDPAVTDSPNERVDVQPAVTDAEAAAEQQPSAEAPQAPNTLDAQPAPAAGPERLDPLHPLATTRLGITLRGLRQLRAKLQSEFGAEAFARLATSEVRCRLLLTAIQASSCQSGSS